MARTPKKKTGRLPDGIKRRNMTLSLPVAVTERLKDYSLEHGESGSNLVARLLADFFRTDGQPPGNIRATLKAKLDQLE